MLHRSSGLEAMRLVPCVPPCRAALCPKRGPRRAAARVPRYCTELGRI
jgi:hypothetical protein